MGTHRERSKLSPSQLGVTQPSLPCGVRARTGDCGRLCLRSRLRPPALQKVKDAGSSLEDSN